jgi:hypothetical protein
MSFPRLIKWYHSHADLIWQFVTIIIHDQLLYMKVLLHEIKYLQCCS